MQASRDGVPIPFAAVPQRDRLRYTRMSDTIEVSRNEFEQLVSRIETLEQENADLEERVTELKDRQGGEE